ncbi:MAG TPA: hypothetical protein VM012_06440 [Flavitalea sp.]|nr:hypothetical protein [Flavitalea sp.]
MYCSREYIIHPLTHRFTFPGHPASFFHFHTFKTRVYALPLQPLQADLFIVRPAETWNVSRREGFINGTNKRPEMITAS